MNPFLMVLASVAFLAVLYIGVRFLWLLWAFSLFSGEEKDLLTPLLIAGVIILVCIGFVRYVLHFF